VWFLSSLSLSSFVLFEFSWFPFFSTSIVCFAEQPARQLNPPVTAHLVMEIQYVG
jgi:hypothetical protein